jgi:CHAT domain-containing protein
MKPTYLQRVLRLGAASCLAACCVLAHAESASAPIDQGYAYLEAGKYRLARLEFEQALKNPNEARAAEIHAAAGYTAYLMQFSEEAKQHLELALSMAEKSHDAQLEMRVRGYLGLLYAAAPKTRPLAPEAFERSLNLARQSGDKAQEYAVRLQLARLETRPAQRLEKLRTLGNDVDSAAMADAARVGLLLNIADQLKRLSEEDKSAVQSEARRLGQTTSERAAALAAKTGLTREQAQAEVYQTGFYEQEGKLAAASSAAEAAVRHAEQANAADVAMAGETARGRLFVRQGQAEHAVEAYRRAAFHVGEVRRDIPVFYQDGSSSYHETLEPIYRNLTDVLLRKSARTPDAEEKRKLLIEAVRTLERLKQSEMEDYFNDRCALDSALAVIIAPPPLAAQFLLGFDTNGAPAKVDGLAVNLASATGKTAILYTVVLDDRLELLLVSNGNIQQKTVAAPQAQIVRQALELNDKLRSGKPYKPASQQLHQWVLAPLGNLHAAGIEHLVYVPDSVLRLVPLAAFYDGHEFAVQHYSTVTNSSLRFTPAQLSKEGAARALLAGLSLPDGPSLDQIPANLLSPSAAKGAPSRGLTDEEPAPVQPVEQPDLRANPTQREQLAKSLALPGVVDEIHAVGEKMPEKTTLMNQTFTSQNLENDIQSGKYRLVHISSHGYFGHSAADSFIMAYDKTLGVNDVERILKPKPDGQAIDLVTFSACETAQGDDRAPLGFSGLAIRANARNAMGALWKVKDEPTRQLMQKYYAALTAANGDAAIALQQAQLGMLKDKGLAHPSYWSAFILTGGW